VPVGDDEPNLRISVPDRAMVCATIPERTRENLQSLMWRNVGITRNGARLLLSARILNLWQRTMPAPASVADFELRNMLIVSRSIVESALARQESRGAHFRSDFPDASDNWRRHIVLGRASS
jgi:L-aspartate oxidase